MRLAMCEGDDVMKSGATAGVRFTCYVESIELWTAGIVIRAAPWTSSRRKILCIYGFDVLQKQEPSVEQLQRLSIGDCVSSALCTDQAIRSRYWTPRAVDETFDFEEWPVPPRVECVMSNADPPTHESWDPVRVCITEDVSLRSTVVEMPSVLSVKDAELLPVSTGMLCDHAFGDMQEEAIRHGSRWCRTPVSPKALRLWKRIESFAKEHNLYPKP